MFANGIHVRKNGGFFLRVLVLKARRNYVAMERRSGNVLPSSHEAENCLSPACRRQGRKKKRSWDQPRVAAWECEMVSKLLLVVLKSVTVRASGLE